MNLFIYFTLFIIALAAWSNAETAEFDSTRKESPSSNVNDEVDKMIEFLKKERELLKQALKEFGSKVHDKLFAMFPELQKQFEEIEREAHIVHECYSQEIDHQSNNSVNIFEHKIHTVVSKYFETHGRILEGLSFEEIKKRVETFLKSLSRVAELVLQCVRDKKKGLKATKYGLTMFTAYSQEEIEAKFVNKKLAEELSSSNGAVRLGDSNPNSIYCNKNKTALDPETLPKSFSWQDKGYVSPVYAQGCGDCFIFSTTSALESQYMIRAQTKLPVQFSIQRTLDCVEHGCHGGLPAKVNDFFRNKGASLAGYDRYNASSNQTFCRKYPSAIYVDVTCEFHLPTEEEVLRLLVRSGPMTVLINASPDIYHVKDSPFHGTCKPKLDHAVLLVGYTPEYYIIKNSWGANWGKRGYLYLPRGGNTCGVRTSLFGAYIRPFPGRGNA